MVTVTQHGQHNKNDLTPMC